MTTDVLIIGSGFAGLAAACEAANAGADCIVLEKMTYFGGNSALAGGVFCSWDSRLKLHQKLKPGEDSWQLQMEDIMKGGKEKSIPQLVEIMVKNAPAALDFLLDAGINFKEALLLQGGHSVARGHQIAISAKKTLRILKEKAEAIGVKVLVGAKVTRIIRDGANGPVTCVEMTDAQGTHTILARRAVIIASGGFARDMGLRLKYDKTLGEGTLCSNHRGATGEMISLAQDIGADTLHMEYIQLFPCANPKTGAVDKWALACYVGPGFGIIYVDKYGKRFVNELAGRDDVTGAQLNSGGAPTYSILDSRIADAMKMQDKVRKNGERFGRMIHGETIDELEQILKMPKGNLAGTIQRRNSFIKQGNDPEFGTPVKKSMLPLAEGPFYAIPQWPSIHYTMGGLRIDGDARVLDASGKPVPRLFAAGEVCGGIHGANRLGGNALTECVVYGRIAGKNAASERVQ